MCPSSRAAVGEARGYGAGVVSRKVVATVVGAVAVYGLAWPLARLQDERVDRLRPLYVDRQQVAEGSRRS